MDTTTLQTHIFPPPPPLIPLPSPPPSPLLLICDLLTEAVVLYGYVKEQDDELSLKVGDIIVDVEQVCTYVG